LGGVASFSSSLSDEVESFSEVSNIGGVVEAKSLINFKDNKL